MKTWGYILLVIGVVYLLYAFNMDVTVTTPTQYIPYVGSVGGGEVANLDLMERRQNHLIVAALITLIGALMAIFGKDENTIEVLATPPSTPPVFDGERDIQSDAYRLWLSQRYEIQRNEVFDRFVVGQQTFESLEDALSSAHAIEERKVADELAEEERVEAEVAADKEAARLASEKAEAEWEEAKPKVVIGMLIAFAIMAGGYFLIRETPEEREARLIAEAAEREEQIEKFKSQFAVNLPDDFANASVEEQESDNDYLCDEIRNGSVLKFRTDMKEEGLKDRFVETLGEGKSQYDGLIDDNHNWVWSRDGTRYVLSMFTYSGATDANLCAGEAADPLDL